MSYWKTRHEGLPWHTDRRQSATVNGGITINLIRNGHRPGVRR
jgi:hypothetical protein